MKKGLLDTMEGVQATTQEGKPQFVRAWLCHTSSCCSLISMVCSPRPNASRSTLVLATCDSIPAIRMDGSRGDVQG